MHRRHLRARPAIACLALVLGSTASPGAGAAAEIPFTRSARGHVLVPVTLSDGVTRRFALDTAAGSSVIAPEVARALGAEPRGPRATLVGEAGRSEHGVATLDRVTVGDRSAAGVPVLIQAFPLDASGAAPFDGILGAPFLRRYDLRVDFLRNTVSLLDPRGGPGDSTGVPIVIREQGHVLIPVRIGDVEVTALLDTGSGHSGINSIAARALGVELPNPAPAGHGLAILAGPIRVGDRTLRDRGQLVVMDRDDIFAPLGLADRPRLLLGTDLLGGRAITISYAEGRLFLE